MPAPGVSISSVAISHGINANVIRKWLPLYRDQPPATLPAFVPIKVTPKRATEPSLIIELRFGEQTVTVKWPSSDPEGVPALSVDSLRDPHRRDLAGHRAPALRPCWLASLQSLVRRSRTALICLQTGALIALKSWSMTGLAFGWLLAD